MPQISEPLASHLAGDTTTICQCWRLTRGDGTVLGFTDHDRALFCDGTLFEPGTGLTASEAKSALDLSVDTVDVEGALSAAAIEEDDIAAGLYDGAEVETLLVNWRDPSAFARLRTAVIGRVTRRDGAFLAELASHTQALDQPNGRTVRRRCDAELGDARCGFDLQGSGFSGAGTVIEAGAGALVRVDGLDGFAGGWFANGLLSWTSGARAGQRERIADHRRDAAGVGLVLWQDEGGAIAAGDAFTIVAGCDKRFETCKTKFSNALNFRGFPHLPGDDAAYGYVVDGDVFDGGALVK